MTILLQSVFEYWHGKRPAVHAGRYSVPEALLYTPNLFLFQFINICLELLTLLY